MKAYKGSRGTAPLILNLSTGRRRVVNFTTRRKTLMPIEQEAGLAKGPVSTFWKREKSLAPTGIQTPDCPACSLVAIPTSSRLTLLLLLLLLLLTPKYTASLTSSLQEFERTWERITIDCSAHPKRLHGYPIFYTLGTSRYYTFVENIHFARI